MSKQQKQKTKKERPPLPVMPGGRLIRSRSFAAAAADIDLDALTTQAENSPAPAAKEYRMPLCQHCGADPMAFDGCVYEVKGAVAGSMEQWKILFCRECRVPYFAAIIAIKKPEGERTISTMQSAPRIAAPPPNFNPSRRR